MSRWYDKIAVDITGKKKHKYGAKRIERAARSFASRAEAYLFDQIKLEERAGELTLLACQEHIKLTDAEIVYIPDYTVQYTKTNEIVYREMKGHLTPEYKLKERLWQYYGPAPLEVYAYDYKTKRCVLQYLVTPKKRKLPLVDVR